MKPTKNEPTQLKTMNRKQRRLKLAREIAERIVGPVEWVSDNMGNCACPGGQVRADGHNPNACDCRIFLGRDSDMACFHGGCDEELSVKVAQLRAALGVLRL